MVEILFWGTHGLLVLFLPGTAIALLFISHFVSFVYIFSCQGTQVFVLVCAVGQLSDRRPQK